MTGIFPEAVAGGLVIRNPDGTPTNPPGVQSAYVPAPGYVSDCDLTALPSDCTARIEAKQINAIVSELLALAECFDPDGPWQCTAPNNLCMSFTTWQAAFQALIQAYVDAAIAAAEGLDESKFVDVAGDTMTGDLAFNKNGPKINFNNIGAAATILTSSHNSSLRWQLVLGNTTAETGGNAGFDFALIPAADDGTPAGTPILFGKRSTNRLEVAGDPTTALGIATKQYVDAADVAAMAAATAAFVNVSGDTMTGPLLLNADPTDPLGAAPKQYVDGIAVGAANAVRYDIAQALTTAQQIQARQNINAAPLTALAYNGMQINGGFDFNQLGTAVGALAAGLSYRCDGWMWGASNAGGKAFTGGQQSQNATFGALGTSLPKGLTYLGIINCTTAGAAVAAGDYALISQPIEGYRIRRLNWGANSPINVPQPITIGFWVAADRAGTMAVSVHNHNHTRSYVVDVPILSLAGASGMQYKTVTVPGDLAGTWNDANQTAMFVTFCFVAGTSSQTPPNAWAASGAWGTPNTTNFFQAAGDRVWVSGVTVVPGSQGFTAEQSTLASLRPWVDELALCQRYLAIFPITQMFGNGQIRAGGTSSYIQIEMPVPSRIQPVLSYPGDLKVYSGDSNNPINTLNVSTWSPYAKNLSTSCSHAATGIASGFIQLYSPTGVFLMDSRMT